MSHSQVQERINANKNKKCSGLTGGGESDILKSHAESSQEKLVVRKLKSDILKSHAESSQEKLVVRKLKQAKLTKAYTPSRGNEHPSYIGNA